MKSNLLIAIALIGLTACGRVDTKDPLVSSSQIEDLTENLVKTESAVAKTERLLRKVRLAEVILAQKHDLASSTLSNCLTDSEIATKNEWNWACNSGTSGVSYFSYNGTSLQKIENEFSTDVTNFGEAREIFNMTDITDSTNSQGNRAISFKLSWSLYKNAVSNNLKVCSASSAFIKLNINKRNKVGKDGKDLMDATGNKIVENFVETIKIDRISMQCDQNLTSSASDDTYIELKTSTLSVTGDNHLLSGELNFGFKDTQLAYNGAMSLNEIGVTEPSESKIRVWSCAGQPLCFP